MTHKEEMRVHAGVADTDGDCPVVHTWDPNSNSGKPLFVLMEKGVRFEHRYVDLLRFEQHSPEFLAVNPSGTVPALIHAGRVFTESTPMCEYIDAAFPGKSLIPSSPTARYRMRWWCRQTDGAAESLSVVGWHNFMGPMVRSLPRAEIDRLIARIPTQERRVSWQKAVFDGFTEPQLAGARTKIADYARQLDRALATSEWLAGDSFSLADVLTFANFYGLPNTMPEAVSIEAAPHLRRWLRRIYARPATMRTFGLARSLARRAFEIAAMMDEGAKESRA